MKQQPGHSIIVIGTSAGGMEALQQLLAQLPGDLPAAVFIVQHLAIDSSAEFLVNRLNQITPLTCVVATHGTPIQAGMVYMAPADQHLLLTEDILLVGRGPRENQFRPSIDPLFRSAAAYYGPQVISIILTGFMYDGVAGTEAVARSGGITVVQDPADAEFPDLPRHLLQHLEPHYRVPVREMGGLIRELVYQPAPETAAAPDDIKLEARLAERVMGPSKMTTIGDLENLGTGSSYSCPECGGALWDVSQPGGVSRFRCHTGHAFTAESLLISMSQDLEETLWVAMRTLEERRAMLLNLASKDKEGKNQWVRTQRQRADEMKVHIERLRSVLQQSALPDSDLGQPDQRPAPARQQAQG
ncbi:MAG: chemotaxis protein CheB [Adhaeribacter sp.]